MHKDSPMPVIGGLGREDAARSSPQRVLLILARSTEQLMRVLVSASHLVTDYQWSHL